MQLASYREATIHQGGEVHLECQADGVPTPLLSWVLPDRSVLTSTARSTSRITMDTNGTLHILQPLPSDRGVYRCVASNSAGAASASVRVHVSSLPPVIQQHKEQHLLMSPGMPVYAQCSARGAPPPTLRWRIPDGTLVRPSQFLHGPTNNTKVSPSIVNNARVTSSSSTDKSRASAVLHPLPLSPFSKARIVSTSPSITTVHYGGLLQLHCSVIGNPSPIIIWRTASRKLVDMHFSFDRRLKVHPNGTLSVQAVTEKDAGDYLCIARNKVADDYRLLRVSVATKPAKIEPRQPLNQMVLFGKPLKVDCQASGLPDPAVHWSLPDGTMVNSVLQGEGSPPPRVSWLLSGNGVLPAPYYGSRLTVHRNGSLELRGVRVTDGGTLVCVVRGERGETRIQVELEVSEPQQEAKSPHRGAVEGPVKESGLIEVSRSGASLDSAQTLSSRPVLPEKLIQESQLLKSLYTEGPPLLAAPHPAGPPPRSTGSASQPAVNTKTAPLVSIINGETLRLSCPASQTHGNTQGSLIWTMPSGKVLSRGESSDSGQYLVQQDGTLTVQHASVFDRGAYTCRSTSNDSSSVSVVTVPVIVIAYPPRITTGPSPVTYTRPGVAVELPCLTIATPRATVTWETPDLTQLRVMGQARIYGNRYLSPQGSLVIQNPTSRDTGFYRCTAKNVIGVDTKSTYLHVI
ncbi:Matrix-remodeling-associated protein 5 [Larimichthys crocea]|uniref:Matrix-remodeling-associated protein 5 n=1 Tax=Larimichthys crocea TaxID=215358 RepID=A0A6G0J798_LARCR|nr:Matrix-remodeling-associated protein 5 [Larimichthys crocea]